MLAGDWLRFATLHLGFALVSGLTQCENQRCFDFDEDGNRFEFPCTRCSENDGNPCTYTSWRVEPGDMCSLDQQPLVPDGDGCELDGVAGVCLSGACQEAAVLEVGAGSTAWFAPTDPPGGGGTFVNGGCFAFATTGPSFVGDVTITLEISSDGDNNIYTAWAVRVENVLFPQIGDAATLGDLQLDAVLTNALGGPIRSTLRPEVQDVTIDQFWADETETTILLETYSSNGNPDAITAGTAAVVPTGGPGSSVEVNWDNELAFRLDLE
jgi:hypothetical protein